MWSREQQLEHRWGTRYKRRSFLSRLLTSRRLTFQPRSLHPVAASYTIGDIKGFLLTAKGKDTKSVQVKKNKDNVKFKVQYSRYLYSLVITKSRQRSWSSPCLQIWQWRSWAESWALIWTVGKFLKFLKKTLQILVSVDQAPPLICWVPDPEVAPAICFSHLFRWVEYALRFENLCSNSKFQVSPSIKEPLREREFTILALLASLLFNFNRQAIQTVKLNRTIVSCQFLSII